MNLNHQPAFLGGWLTDLGHGIGNAARGILDVSGKAIQVATTRGGADSDVVVREAPTPESNLSQYAIPGAIASVGILALVAVMVSKPKRRR